MYLFLETYGIGVTLKVRSWASKKARSGPRAGSNSSGQFLIQTFPEPPRSRRLSDMSCRARCTKAFVSSSTGVSSRVMPVHLHRVVRLVLCVPRGAVALVSGSPVDPRRTPQCGQKTAPNSCRAPQWRHDQFAKSWAVCGRSARSLDLLRER